MWLHYGESVTVVSIPGPGLKNINQLRNRIEWRINCYWSNSRNNNLAVSIIYEVWIKIWQHRNSHCVHASVTTSEIGGSSQKWLGFSHFLLCLCHFICESCNFKFASHYIANRLPCSQRQINDLGMCLGAFQNRNFVTLENHCSLTSRSISPKASLNHRKTLVRCDLYFRGGTRCLTWCEIAFDCLQQPFSKSVGHSQKALWVADFALFW